MGNYTIHAPRSWYNNRKAVIILTLCPHAAGAAGWAIIPFVLCTHGIITAKRRNENFTVSMPCRRRKGALFHWRRKPAHIVLSGSL